MSQAVEPHLPDLLRLARSLTKYPVTLRKDTFDGEEVYVFAIQGIPWESETEEWQKVSFAISEACWDGDIDRAIAVLPENTVGAPDPGSRRRPPPAPTA